MPMLFWMVLPFALWDTMSAPAAKVAPAGPVDPLRPQVRKPRKRSRVNASA